MQPTAMVGATLLGLLLGLAVGDIETITVGGGHGLHNKTLVMYEYLLL